MTGKDRVQLYSNMNHYVCKKKEDDSTSLLNHLPVK
jgi:hypothetical protein